MSSENFTEPISSYIWDTKYRFREGGAIRDRSIQDTWRRVAQAVASAEPSEQQWADRFYETLADFKFLPGGRIIAGAGTQRRVTLFNCFMTGIINDSIDGIFKSLREGALTMQQGGGVGYDFSTLRPYGTRARAIGGIASGPVSFMHIWDSMCATLISSGNRRGAMMAALRCDHPDIEAFIDAKRNPHELRHFNLSVLVTDDFIQAVRNDGVWPLVFPAAQLGKCAGKEQRLVMRQWSGAKEPISCKVVRVVKARSLWERLMRASYDCAEPGVLFIDRINRSNNLWYREQISATNPCGEIPLPPYGACNLGSINITRFVRAPFTARAHIDMTGIEAMVRLAVRMLDNVIDVSRFPLQRQQEQARGSRRIGLGITGLADTLIMLGIRYGSDESYQLTASIMQTLCYTAYRASADLAEEKGAFPYYESDKYLQGKFIRSLPDDIQELIIKRGLRNSHLTAIAPTGTISLLANNVSSGLEPVFAHDFDRKIRQPDGDYRSYVVTDYACSLWHEICGDQTLPTSFVDIHSLAPEVHLRMQAAIQPYIDNAISKTINIPEDFDFKDYQAIYAQAYELGLKGCTTFRPNPVTGAVLTSESADIVPPAHCCSIERESA